MVHPVIDDPPRALDLPVIAPFTITITYSAAGVTIVEVAGELDLATSLTLDFHLAHVLRERSCCEHLILNVSRLSFCGAAGLSSLLQAQDVANQRDVVVCLVSAPLMDRVLGLTGLRDRFRTYPDLTTARDARTTAPCATVQRQEAS